MTDIAAAGRYRLGERDVFRMGYGAMQLAGPGVFGPPKDRGEAIAVLRAAVAAGVDHIDTSDFYGPFVVNELIREALHPYPENLVIVSKVGARRDDTGAWLPAQTPAELLAGIEDNNRRLGIEALHAVNLRLTGDVHAPAEGSLAARFEALADAQRRGLVRHLGVSNVTAAQLAEARSIAPVVCVQNLYNLVMHGDDPLVDETAAAGIAFVPFFPLGGFAPLQSAKLSSVAKRLEATPMQVALAWLLARSTNMLLIPGTSSRAHLAENLAAAELTLPAEAIAELDSIANAPA